MPGQDFYCLRRDIKIEHFYNWYMFSNIFLKIFKFKFFVYTSFNHSLRKKFKGVAIKIIFFLNMKNSIFLKVYL